MRYIAIAIVVAFACSAFAFAATTDLSRDPQWDGYRNRLKPNPPVRTEQNFGYSRTNHVGAGEGEIGGTFQRSVTPAYYGMTVPAKTLDDAFTASGKFAVTRADGASGVNIGWFNDAAQGWRTPNTLVMRFDGNGGKYWVFFEYCTQHWFAGGKGAFEGERYQTTKTPPFKADGSVHSWSLRFDPKTSKITFVVDDRRYEIDVPPENRADGAQFNRFGLLNLMTQGNQIDAWFGDLTVDGRKIDLSKDPGWDAKGNHANFEERIVRPFHDFGYSPGTNIAGGAAKGEIGGVMWRDETPAYYAAKTEKLSLNDELSASGKLAFTGAGSDSGVCLGWFDSQSKKGQTRPQNEVPPTNLLAIMIEGPSRVGHYFRPAYANAKGKGQIVDTGPVIRPDGKSHTWSIHYDPRGAGGLGRITWKLDDKEQSFDLKPGEKEAGATFDRFGFFDVQSGGHYVFMYVDDVTYTSSPAK